jgi:fluoride exporter
MELAFNRQQRLMAPTDTRSLSMPISVAVAVGGALGALSRYLVDRFIEARELGLFPWSTFTINVSGCFIVGAVIGALVDRHHTPAWLRIGLVMGILGGYTTFSTFSQETFDLFEEGRAAVAMTYVAGSVALGVVAVLLGSRLGRLV